MAGGGKMISDMLEQIQLMKQADEVKLARVTEQFIAAMGVITAMREWASAPSTLSVQALRQAEARLDEVLNGGPETCAAYTRPRRVHQALRTGNEVQGEVLL